MIRRSLAERLARHALDVMPPERRTWARGMAAELDHIEDDGAALGFALGAVWTGYRQGAHVPSNWLRLGRWGVAGGAAALGLLLFYLSGWLRRPPEAYDAVAPFSGLAVLLGCAYLGAGWSLAKRRLRLFFTLLAGMFALLAGAVVVFPRGVEIGSAQAFYAALLRQEPATPHAFYAALLLEEFVFIAGLACAGAVFWRFERRRTPG